MTVFLAKFMVERLLFGTIQYKANAVQGAPQVTSSLKNIGPNGLEGHKP